MSAATPAPTGIPYQGIAEPTPGNSFFRRRAPTPKDYSNYSVGDRWMDRSTNRAWILVSKAGGPALWQLMSGAGIVWNDTSASVVAFVNNGYFISSASIATLPLGALGDTIEIMDLVGGGVVIKASGTDKIRIAAGLSSAGGTATSTTIGSGVRLVFSVAAGAWVAQPTPLGTWTMA